MYQQIHREMTDDDPGDDGGRPEVVDGPYTSRFFPWPHTGRAGDPVINDLNRVGCHGPAGPTKVNVSMFWWAGDRGEYIASKFLDLAHEGCRVSIIYGAPSVKIATRLREAASHHVISLWDSRWDFNKDHEVDVRTHSKYILVNGRFGGDDHSCQVMMGTANWNPGSLARGDENSLNIAKCSAWQRYINNWNLVRRHSRKLPYN
jgi:PLD-like domain